MVVFNFIWYCIKCMLNGFCAMFGRAPEGFTIKEGLIGAATLIVIMIIIFLILWLTGVIKFKKKNNTKNQFNNDNAKDKEPRK